MTRAVPNHATPANFIASHTEFSSLDVLRKPNVLLYCLTADSAYFIQHNETENLHDTRKHPIIHLSQTALAIKLIRMSHAAFVRFGNSVNVDEIKVVWLFHCLRCGSTAFSQVFNALPDWVAISEVMPLFCLFEMREQENQWNYVNSSTFKSLTEAIVKCQLKNMAEKQGVFIKTTLFDEHMAPVIRKVFPNHRLLFLYRNVKPASRSMYKAFMSMAGESMMALTLDPYTQNHEGRRQRRMDTLGCLTSFIKNVLNRVRPQSMVEWYTLQWSIRNHMIKHTQHKHGTQFYLLRYESLMESPSETLSKLFDFLEVKQTNLDVALDSLKIDSQEGSS